MAGTAGTRGPVPKRSEERRRTNKESEADRVAPLVGEVLIPEPDDTWHEIALDWYVSLAESGQSRYFEPSDWEAARYLATVMSLNLLSTKFSAVLFASVWSAMNDLLTTEASRRRIRMEIERGEDKPVPASVVAMDAYRKVGG